VGFLNILESCRQHPPDHLIYASSSSVYGANTEMPFCEDDKVDHPVSLYAATKRANELLAQSYCHLYGLQATGLRFFTVYGPWGRPDMALFKFTEAMLQGREISLFNGGEMSRDFTYIDDVVEVLYRLQDQCPAIDGDRGINRLFNVGCGNPVALCSFVECLEEALGIKAQIRFLPMQEGDVLKTWADVSSLERCIGFAPKVRIDQGVKAFVNWYRDFYQI
jgi:UDP-glucuronate 4-epimerase